MWFGRRQIVLALCAVNTLFASNSALAQGTAPTSDAGDAGQHDTCR